MIELLMVITVIAILAAIILPSLHNAKLKSHLAVCKSNMKQINVAMTMYMDDLEIDEPLTYIEGTGDYYNEPTRLEDFITYTDLEVLFCPSGDKNENDYNAAGNWSAGYTYYYNPADRTGLTSENVVIGDVSPTWNEYASQLEHYNAMLSDGSVVQVTNDFTEFSNWLNISVVNP